MECGSILCDHPIKLLRANSAAFVNGDALKRPITTATKNHCPDLIFDSGGIDHARTVELGEPPYSSLGCGLSRLDVVSLGRDHPIIADMVIG